MPIYHVPILGYFIYSAHHKECIFTLYKSYLFFELLCAFVALCIYTKFFPILHALFLCAICAVLLLLSLDDWSTAHIRDSDLCIYTFFLVLDTFFFNTGFWFDHCIGTFIVALPLFFIMRLRPNALGSGDVIFMACSGFYLGTAYITHAFLLGTVCALVYAGYLVLLKKASRYSAIPLIPFLAVGVAVVIIFSSCK